MAECEEDRMVVVFDWYAAHLDASVRNLIEHRGHKLLLLGGGTTGVVQVPDTHLHYSFSQIMKRAEEEHNFKSLSINRSRLPVASKALKKEHTEDAWSKLDHEASVRGHVANGITNALGGSEDLFLSRDVLPWWTELDMSNVRMQLIAEVEAGVMDGSLSSWDDFDKLIELYDEHAGAREGQEDAYVELEPEDLAQLDEGEVGEEAETELGLSTEPGNSSTGFDAGDAAEPKSSPPAPPRMTRSSMRSRFAPMPCRGAGARA